MRYRHPRRAAGAASNSGTESPMSSHNAGSNNGRGPVVNFPRPDYSRIPYWLYRDEEIYRLEQERIFKGPTWSFVGLEAEIPNPGDFRTNYIGETPIIVNRALDETLHIIVNRCAHKRRLARPAPPP